MSCRCLLAVTLFVGVVALVCGCELLTGLIGGDQDPTLLFTDVPVDHWAYEDLVYLHDRGIITALPEGEYHGDEPLDRYSAAALIARSIRYVVGDPSRVTAEDLDVLKDLIFQLSDEVNELRNQILDKQFSSAVTGCEQRAQAATGYTLGVIEADQDPTSLFTDVPVDHWAYEDLVYLHDRGIITALPEGEYHGDEPLDRYSAAALIARSIRYVMGDPSRVTAEDLDVLKDLIFQLSDEVNELRNQILDKQFGSAVTGCEQRAQAATGYTLGVIEADQDPTSLFTDVPVDHWAYEDLVYLHDRGIITALPEGEYHGDEPLDRYSAAALIARSIRYVMGDPSRVTAEDLDVLKDLIFQLSDEVDAVRDQVS